MRINGLIYARCALIGIPARNDFQGAPLMDIAQSLLKI